MQSTNPPESSDFHYKKTLHNPFLHPPQTENPLYYSQSLSPEKPMSQTLNNYNQSLGSSYKHYSKNLYSLIDDNSTIQDKYNQTTSFKANFLLTSLSLTDQVQVIKTVIPKYLSNSQQCTRFSIKSLDENETDSEDPFQSSAFSTEILMSGGLTFCYNPDTQINKNIQDQPGEPKACAELLEEPFTELKDKFLVISLKTPEKTLNLGNIRYSKNRYQIFNASGLPLYGIADVLTLSRAQQKVNIIDVQEKEIGNIDFSFEGLNKLVAGIEFSAKISPREKLLVIGAVFIMLGRVSWTKGKITKENKEECSVGFFMGAVLKKFCNTG